MAAARPIPVTAFALILIAHSLSLRERVKERARIEIAMIEEKTRDYFKNKEEVIAIYLFGSYAEGRERDLSDIDIGIILDGRDSSYFQEKRDVYMVELGRILRKDIDAVILNSANEALLRQVFLKGKCILVRDKKKLALHKTVMFSRVAELGYYRSRMQAGLIRKVIRG